MIDLTNSGVWAFANPYVPFDLELAMRRLQGCTALACGVIPL